MVCLNLQAPVLATNCSNVAIFVGLSVGESAARFYERLVFGCDRKYHMPNLGICLKGRLMTSYLFYQLNHEERRLAITPTISLL